MNLLVLAAVAAGAYAYNKNPEFKEKADQAGAAIKTLAEEAYKEVKEAVEAKKNEK